MYHQIAMLICGTFFLAAVQSMQLLSSLRIPTRPSRLGWLASVWVPGYPGTRLKPEQNDRVTRKVIYGYGFATCKSRPRR
eukprot:749971-Rhodomonas_salina.1